MLFLKTILVIAAVTFFIIIEMVSILEHGREFIYGLFKDMITHFTNKRKKGVIPNDKVQISKIKKSAIANIKFDEKLELCDEYETIITILDENGDQMEVTAPGSVFDEMYETIGKKHTVSSNEITRINIVMERSDFDVMRLAHYKKQIDDLSI